MAEPVDMIVPMLKEMRAEIASLRARMDERFGSIERHHDECLAMLLARTAARAKYLERRA